MSGWSWKKKSDIFIFTFIGTFFGLNTFINMKIDDNIYTNYEMTSLVLVLLGYIGLFIFNLKNKWIFGVIIISILLSISIFRIYRAYFIMNGKS